MERSTGIALSKTSSEPLYKQLFDQIVSRISEPRVSGGLPVAADAQLGHRASNEPQHGRSRVYGSRGRRVRRLDRGPRHLRRARRRRGGDAPAARPKEDCPGPRSWRALPARVTSPIAALQS